MTPAPHGSLTRVLVAAAATTSFLVAAAAAIGVATALNDTGTVCFDGGPPPCATPANADPVGPCVEDVCNYLLLGSDSRRGLTSEEIKAFGTDRDIGGQNRADTIMVVHTDPRRERAIVLSFPRDLWVTVPHVGPSKINRAFEGGVQGGGPLLMASTIHRLTGLKINHFLYVDLAGFQGIVNELGGVELNIPSKLDDPLTDLHLRPGTQVLDGRQALAYVRTRALPCDSGNPDFARIGRQQQFLRALINRMLQPGQLARIPALVEPVLGNLRRDPDLEVADLAFLVGQLQGLDTGAVDFRAVPGTSKLIHPGGYPNGLAIVEMDPSAERLFEAIRTGGRLPGVGVQLEGVQLSPAGISVPVLDAGGGEAATQVLDLLSVSGFDISAGVVPATDADVPSERSVIAYGAGELEAAQVVQQHLPQLETIEVHGLSGVAVVAAPDYRSPDPGSGAPATCVGTP